MERKSAEYVVVELKSVTGGSKGWIVRGLLAFFEKGVFARSRKQNRHPTGILVGGEAIKYFRP